MRGSQTFNTLFADAPVMEAKRSVGRDAEFIERRNTLLLHRYYWHGRRELEPGKRMGYDSLINTIAAEFFLSKIRVIKLVAANYNALAAIKRQYNGATDAQISKAMSKQFAWLVW